METGIDAPVRSRPLSAAGGSGLATLLALFDGPDSAVVACTSEGTIGFWSAAAERLLGKKWDDVCGQRLSAVLDSAMLPPVGRKAVVQVNGRQLQVEAREVREGYPGISYPLLLLFRCIAEPDASAGLSGRTRVLDQLQDALARHLRQDSHGALLILDVDDFASLRCELGAAASEAVLDAVGARLRPGLAPDDCALRLDGDQFALVLSALSHCPDEAAALARQRARSLLDRLAEPFDPPGPEGGVRANVGVTVFGAHGASPESLLREALFSLRAAKIGGPDAVHVFHERMRQVHRRQQALRADLRQALRQRELQVHYQPQVDVDGRPTGVEALVRWHHPREGWVPPDLFIPVAEACGLVCELGQFVLEQACQQLARWRDGLPGSLTVSVNVSPLQLRQADFAERVLDTLRANGADPRRLKLEITETALIDEMERAVGKLALLRSAGVLVSLDDFGKGYSALAYLKRLPLDQVKIDQAFVRDIVGSSVDEDIAGAIITLAQCLHLDVIAEGVETEEQYALLRALGCRAFQGYLFGKPQPVEAVEAWLAAPGQGPR